MNNSTIIQCLKSSIYFKTRNLVMRLHKIHEENNISYKTIRFRDLSGYLQDLKENKNNTTYLIRANITVNENIKFLSNPSNVFLASQS